MKTKQPPVIYRVVSRGDKTPLGYHNSGSTVEASDHRITSTKTSQIYNAESSLPTKSSKSPQSQTISILRSQLKNIKSSVTRLIEEGLVRPPSTIQWLQSSQNFSSMSKNSLGSSTIKSNSNKSPQQFSKILDQSFTKHRNQIEELQNLRQDHQKLKIMCRIKDEKQADAIIKHKKLSEEANALRKSKQQLVKCIQILQMAVRQANEQLKYYMAQNKKLQQQLSRLKYQKDIKQKDCITASKAITRLEEEMEYRKAQNNQLITIIELKEQQVQLLREKHAQQIRNIQIQNRNAQQNYQRNSRIHENTNQYNRRWASNDKNQEYYRRAELDRLYSQIQVLRSELENREKVMGMMLNDIRSMDKELKQYDVEHEELIKCRKLIQSLNEQLTKMEAKKLASKYKYF